MKKFEYLFSSIIASTDNNSHKKEFERLGQLGWEYCGNDHLGYQVFKREIAFSPEEKFSAA